MSLFKIILLSGGSELKIAQFAFTAHDNEYNFTDSTGVSFAFSQGG